MQLEQSSGKNGMKCRDKFPSWVCLSWARYDHHDSVSAAPESKRGLWWRRNLWPLWWCVLQNAVWDDRVEGHCLPEGRSASVHSGQTAPQKDKCLLNKQVLKIPSILRHFDLTAPEGNTEPPCFSSAPRDSLLPSALSWTLSITGSCG